ncbi:early nodulin-like protein 9 [Raphanus sativus]|uniref:Early nodulin-like protein 9 n=1 Tax=Raphanus sativus TaxID=3726 RepID=A0A6J0P2L6_RAPSA|nr:early nodulin-like protein 9 [Raphanus sativus]XP_056856205.1 early nodulin-like protein 9 [Raphanus sativus]KAJ4867886.1 early nodulin-like protein 9 [Raphanus sativus]KAJ4897751.1 early nodulin-like protein 9 [Raphanus sativus]
MVWNLKNMMLHGFGLVCLFMTINKAYAREFAVGGAKGWTVPSGSQVYSQWAEQSRFQIGDSLLFVYQSNQDSVLQVTRDAYDSCNTDAPTAKFADGKTSFALAQSGPYYFISGNKDHCHKNEKLVVIVMADRSGNKNNNTTSSSPPSTAPAPSGEYAPSPPMEGALEPPAATPTPSQETPNNSASPSSSFVAAAALLGTALASTLFLH